MLVFCLTWSWTGWEGSWWITYNFVYVMFLSEEILWKFEIYSAFSSEIMFKFRTKVHLSQAVSAATPGGAIRSLVHPQIKTETRKLLIWDYCSFVCYLFAYMLAKSWSKNKARFELQIEHEMVWWQNDGYATSSSHYSNTSRDLRECVWHGFDQGGHEVRRSITEGGIELDDYWSQRGEWTILGWNVYLIYKRQKQMEESFNMFHKDLKMRLAADFVISRWFQPKHYLPSSMNKIYFRRYATPKPHLKHGSSCRLNVPPVLYCKLEI